MASSASPIVISPQLRASSPSLSSSSSSSKTIQWAPLSATKSRFTIKTLQQLQGSRLSMSKGMIQIRAAVPRDDVQKTEGLGFQKPGNSKPGLQKLGFQELGFQKEEETILQRVSKVAMDCLKSLGKPAVVALVIGFLMTQILPEQGAAWAASGGVMGGRSFSSSSGRASSSARTYSAPPSSRNGFTFSAPYAAPSPFFGGGFGGPSIYVAPAYSVGIGGGGGFLFLLLGFLAFFLVSGFLTDRNDSSLFTSTRRKTSVLKLQVGLLGMARSLQQDLDNIAEQADTSTPEGLHYLLTETVLSLLRHPDYCISGYSSADVKRDSEAGEKLFNELSLEERAKFDEETIVNVNNRFRRSAAKSTSRFNNEYIVVTLLVAAEGEFKLPPINNNADLKEALRKIGAIPKDQTLAVEVLWTPQDQNDTLSEREILRDYPLLRSL